MSDDRRTPYIWDREDDEYKAEVIGAACEMTELCQGIAEALGPGWSFGGLRDEYGRGAILRYKFEDMLYLRRDHGKVGISGQYPHYAGRAVLCYDEKPHRNCTMSRGPKAIAGDIKAYLLADVMACRKKALETIERYKVEYEEKVGRVSEFSAAFEQDPPEVKRDHFSYPGVSFGHWPTINGDITFFEENVTIKVEKLPFDAALRVCRAIHAEMENLKGGEDDKMAA